MSAAITDTLQSFHAFVAEKIADGREMSPELALALWRERLREATAIREGLEAVDRGESRPVEAFLTELDVEFGLNAE